MLFSFSARQPDLKITLQVGAIRVDDMSRREANIENKNSIQPEGGPTHFPDEEVVSCDVL
jgi:hypothetical protein